jgi:hypothetical protein
VLWGVVALCAAALPAAAYDYPDPTGWDVHTSIGYGDMYLEDYPIFIHDVKAWDYTGSWPGNQAWIDTGNGDYPWHERNLTNTRGMYLIASGGEGPFYWHGDFRGIHCESNYKGGVGSERYGPWLHEEVPSASDPVYLEFFLGGLYPVNMMCVFNYADAQEVAWDDPAATYYKRGIQDVIIKYKQNQMDAWTTLGAYKFGFPPAGVHAYGWYGVTNQYGPFDDPNDTPFARPVKFGDKLARYVQFEILSNWGDAQFVGCNEIRFYAPGSAYLLFPTKMLLYTVNFPTRMLPYTVNNFGPVEVGGEAHQAFTVMNVGTEDSMMRFDVIDTSFLAGTGFTLENAIAPGTDLRGALLIDGGISTMTLGTIAFSPPDIGEYEGNVLLEYTDARGTHQTTVTVQGTGRYGSWGSIWCKADAWRSGETWDWCPSYGGFRMANGTNMNDPAKGTNGSRKGTVGRYDPATGTSAVWGWGHVSGYYGWYGWRRHWVCFDFEQNVTIDEMLVWNSPNTTGCAKDVIISYTTEAVPHHGSPQGEPDLGPGGYPSLYERQSDQWIMARGHESGIEDARWTPLAGTNRSGEAAGAHRFAQVMDGQWNRAPEKVDFGGVTARQVRFDFLHDGAPGAWGHRTRAPGEWSLQGTDTSQSTNPPGYGNWGNDRFIYLSQVRFYSGGPYPELKADLPAATGDMLRSSTNPYDLKPFVFPTLFYPFVTTSTALHIGNVGDSGTTVRIQEITFMDEDGDGSPDPGPFSVGLGSVALPKSYAAGTTEAVTLVWGPIRELGTYDASVVVVADDGAGNLNKAVIPIRATSMAFEPGYIKPTDLASVVSLKQLDTNWCAASAYDRTKFKEDPARVIGSKGGKSLRTNWAINPLTGINDWPGWLDDIRASTSSPPLEAPHYLEIDLGSPRSLEMMHIFNHQQGAGDNWNAALKDIYVEYKRNAGDAWTRLGGAAYRIHNWYISDGAHPVEAPPANQINTHAPFAFPAATQAQFVRIEAAGPIGDNDPNQSGLFGNWGSVNYWGCADIALYEIAPEISLSTDTLDYGAIAAATTLDKTVTITNPGKATLQVTDVAIEGTGVPYSVVGSSAFSVAAGASQDLTIRFAPTARGDYSNVRMVIVNTASYFSFVTLNGIGTTAGSAYTVASPAGGGTIAFGDVNVGQPRNRYVTLKNLGDTDLEVASIDVAGEAFSAGPAVPLTVEKHGGEARIGLVCTPPSEGPFTGAATIALTGDAAVPTLTYSLTAKGVIAPPAAAGRAWVMYH